MKTQALTLALSALALLSITAADAQTRYGYTVNGSNVMTNSAVLGGTNVLTYPAVVDGSAVGLSCAPLFGDLTHFDNEVDRIDNNRGLLSGLFGSRDTRLGVTSYSAVIPNQLGARSATKVCGQQLSNEMFSLRLFGMGFGFGKVNPDSDMRPAGHAADY